MSYVIADPHFGHERLIRSQEDRSPMRNFATAEEMDEHIVNRWNRVVTDRKTRVYVLGDIAMQRRHIATLGRLNGRLVLVRGNHDVHKLRDYLPYFDDIRGCFVYQKKYILTHIPIHPNCMYRYRLNIHGHLHDNVVMLDGRPDPRYVNVCVEQTSYAPVNLDLLLDRYIV